MVNGLGVLGYGVGGIEAEAVLLGQPLYQPMPHVVGVRLHGELPRGSTATDLVLVVTEMLRAHGVVGAFVEFAGDGLAGLALADRATISNMSPEFGATATLFPIDDETLAYLRLTGRSAERVALVERYARSRGCGASRAHGPDFDELLELDLATRRAVRRRARGGRRTASRSPSCARTSGRTSRTASGRSTRRASRGAGRDGEVEEASRRVVPGDRTRRRSRRVDASTRRAAGRDRVGAGVAPVDGRCATARSTVEVDGQRGDDPDRLGRDRRDHLVHEHLEPDRDGRGRAAGPERRRPRPARRADGQDLARARARRP